MSSLRQQEDSPFLDVELDTTTARKSATSPSSGVGAYDLESPSTHETLSMRPQQRGVEEWISGSFPEGFESPFISLEPAPLKDTAGQFQEFEASAYQEALLSPFVDTAHASREEWEGSAALKGESPFLSAFEQASTGLSTPEELEEEFVDEEEQATADDFSVGEVEAYDEEALADLEESQKEVYYEEEAPYVEGEAGEAKPLARMKFEIQTGNRIWRNDGQTAILLERKYGPDDFLVDKKGVRLESETRGVLEFETEWFRTWPKLKDVIEKAVKVTDDMNRAASAKFEKKRKKFPFNIDHLRKGSKKEIAQGFWDRKPGMEGESERILRTGEELEVEIIDPAWKAGIQSSESLLLEYYESFLRQHEWPFYRDGTIKHAKAILDGANTGGIHATELGKLRSFLQIIVNYIMRGQGGEESEKAGAFADVQGMPPKQAFTLMSRTNFASMYQVLLTEKEKRLFQEIVKHDLVLKEMGLDRKSPVFIKGYGTKKHEPGPTVHQWLAGIIRGVDLLSVQSGKGLSAAMGRYNVETRKGKKDRWLVKFETRNTTIGATGIEAKDWVKYASKLFDLASKRERDALDLTHKQGIVDENELTNFVFHARHPELGRRQIRNSEHVLAQEWLQIRNDLVRPSLQGVQPELEQSETAEDHEQSYPVHFYSNMEHSADDEAEDAELEGEVLSDAGEYKDESERFELLVPKVSPIRMRIDEYFGLANAEYTLPNGTKVRARPQFHSGKTPHPEDDAALVRRILKKKFGGKFLHLHDAIRCAAYGRARPDEIRAITQGLIDAGEFELVRRTNDMLSDVQAVRAVQDKFNIGIDCAGYVQLAFIFALRGKHDDARCTLDASELRDGLGLKARRGSEKLADLPPTHFTNVQVLDAQTGDLFVMKPRTSEEIPENLRDNTWHTAIVVDHSVSGSIHTFLVDASWGFLYGEEVAGVDRRKLVYDTSTKKWWDVIPSIPGLGPQHKNSIGPYFGHRIKGMYRSKLRGGGASMEVREGLEVEELSENGEDLLGVETREELARGFDEEGIEPEVSAEEAELEGEGDEAHIRTGDRELDPVLADLAEKTIAREAPFLEHEKAVRWTRCFSAEDIAKV